MPKRGEARRVSQPSPSSGRLEGGRRSESLPEEEGGSGKDSLLVACWYKWIIEWWGEVVWLDRYRRMGRDG